MENRAKPLIVPIFIPHSGCPHQCVFCNQKAITGNLRGEGPDPAIAPRVERYLAYAGDLRKEVQIAFYGGTFLGLGERRIHALLGEGEGFVRSGRVKSMRFSTRPDTVTPRTLEMIADYSVKTVELGVQSMDDAVLAASGRGHTAADAACAARELKARGYELGLQMMVGLPGDTPEKSRHTATRLADMKPDFVRIYPTVVVTGSPLADRYEKGAYTPLDLGQAVDIVKDLYLIFRKRDIPVIRMGLHAESDLADGSALLAGPFHPAFGHMVISRLFLDMAETLLGEPPSREERDSVLTIHVNRRSISRMRGLSNTNIRALARSWPAGIHVIPAPDLGEMEIRIGNRTLTPEDLKPPA